MYWIVELREDGCNSEIGINICLFYEAIIKSISDLKLFEVYVVRHKLLYVCDLFETLGYVDENILMHEGF